jgi:opacity protein-like surface antigen
MKSRKIVLACVALLAVAAVAVVAAPDAEANRGDGALGVVFVRSQGLYYDTFVTAEELPPRGRFQLLENGETEYGPGDQGYVGGRWKVSDGKGGFNYFLCPLLGPGRTSP